MVSSLAEKDLHPRNAPPDEREKKILPVITLISNAVQTDR